ncbi:protein of unknown function, partial [Paenimyroides ummariense]
MTKIKLILLIFGEELDFTSITDIMKLTPTNFWKKGDKILGRKRELIRQESCWELDFEFVNTMFLDEVTDQIVSKLSNNLKEVEQYINDNCKSSAKSRHFIKETKGVFLKKNVTLIMATPK